MTLLIKKYNYQPIPRNSIDGKRLYSTPDGHHVPSVTTILDSTKDKTHLIEWRKKVGEAKARQITTEAANRGTRMHTFLEQYIETGVWPTAGSNPYSIEAYKMAEVIRDCALSDMEEIWGSEINLYIPQIYAGTTDLVGVYKGNPSICDFKQTNKPKKTEWVTDYFLQLVSYAECHNELYGTDIREGHVFMCSKDLKYQQFDVWPEDYDKYKNLWWDRVYQYYETLS